MNRVFLIILFCISAHAGSFGTSGGGDVNAEEFFKIANTEYRYLKISGSADALKYVSAYKKYKSEIIVRFTETALHLNNQEVQAINHPSNLTIEVSLKHWSRFTPSEKLKLVMHELTSLLVGPDNNYIRSSNLIGVSSTVKKSAFKLWENKIVLKIQTPHFTGKLFLSQEGIIFFQQKILDNDYLCEMELFSPAGTEVTFSNTKITKSYFISTDFSSQKNTIAFSLKSNNGTNIADLVCSNFTQEVGTHEPEAMPLEQFISILAPLLED